MHKDFADWYRAGGIEPDGEALPKRWAAIHAFDAGRDDFVDAARIFYGFKPRTPDFLTTFRAALQKADPAIKMSGNDPEIAVLAGAFLADALENYSEPFCYLAALATLCPAAKNLRKPPAAPAIPELATATLAQWSANRFSALPSATTSSGHLPAAGIKELKDLCEAGDLTAMSEPLVKIYSAVRKMQREALLHSEETNMLWWLFGEHSRDRKEPFKSYSLAAACLIAGKELADLTVELPGPAAATAFLDRLVRANRKKISAVTIQDAVNDAPADWKQNFLDGYSIDAPTDLTPVAGALKAAANVPKGTSWLATYKHTTGVDADAQIAPEDLADQVYLEQLLFRSWSLAGSDE